MEDESALTFLTWNLAMLERSAEAPRHWDQSSTEAAIRDVVLELEPDLVLYQELPGLVPFVETHSMVPANPRMHSGNLATLIRNQLATSKLSVKTVEGALLTTFVDREFTIANVHLAAGKGAKVMRLTQLTSVIEASPTKALLIVGDTNMRVAEADRFLELGFSGEKPPVATWDSKHNRFREAMPEFSAYFTRWFASPGVTVSAVRVHTTPTEASDRRFYLSDHFAMSGRVTLTES